MVAGEAVQQAPFVVQQIERRVGRQIHRQHGMIAAQSLLFDGAGGLQGARLDGPHEAGAVAMRAGDSAAFVNARAEPLARHLQQPERADPPDLDAGPVAGERVLEPALDLGVVAPVVHVDEVDDDDAGKVAQAKLAGHFVRRLEIGLDGGLLDIALAGRAPGVHVDGHQRFGRIDDQIAAGRKLHPRRVQVVELVLDAAGDEQRLGPVLVLLHPPRVARHQRLHEVLGAAIGLVALDQHLVDVASVKVADRALHQVGFLIDERRRRARQRVLADALPGAGQEVVVALDLGLGALDAGGPHDDRRAVGDLEAFDDGLQLPPVGRVDDLARDAAAMPGVRHQHAIAPGKREIGGQRRPLRAALFLGDLHQHDLAALDDLLDLVLPAEPVGPAPVFLRLVAAVGPGVGFFGVVILDLAAFEVAFAARGRFLLDQRLAVFLRQPVVVGMDIRERQEAVPVAAIVDEGGLKRGFDAGDLAEIDIAFQGRPGGGFVVEVLKPAFVHDSDPGFFRMRCIDKHAPGH